MISPALKVETHQVMSLPRSSLVVAVEEVGQLLTDAEVHLLTRLLTQTLQFIDVPVTIVFECEQRVTVELAESPGLTNTFEDALDKRVTKPEDVCF